MGPETYVLQKDVGTSHAPPEGGALDYRALSASPMDGTGAGQSRRAPGLTLEASDGEWQTGEASLYRARMAAKGHAIAFSDEELSTLILHTKALGFIPADIEAILTVKLRRPNVACETLMEVADCLARKRDDKRIGFKEGWDFMKAYRAAQDTMLGGSALEPELYLDAEYIESHRKAFSGTASYLLPGTRYDDFVNPEKTDKVNLGYQGALYVSTKAEIDRVLNEADGDILKVENALGIRPFGWHGLDGIWRVDILDPEAKGLRIPTGAEASANAYWTPGAMTSGGTLEGVLDEVPRIPENHNAYQVIWE